MCFRSVAPSPANSTSQNPGASGNLVDGDDRRDIAGRCVGEWRVREHSPPSERGVPPSGRRLQGCAFGVGGKGGGGSTAGGRRGMLPHGRFAKALICLLLEWSCACLRRHPAVLPPPRPLPLVFCQAMDIPSMAAPPPSRSGDVLSPSLCLAFVGFRRWFHYNPRRTKTLRASFLRPLRVSRREPLPQGKILIKTGFRNSVASSRCPTSHFPPRTRGSASLPVESAPGGSRFRATLRVKNIWKATEKLPPSNRHS